MVTLFLVALSLVACDSPAQIVEISPQRGAREVRTNLPVSVRFDRGVDRTSVVDRFRVSPSTTGQIVWKNSNTLVFQHAPFAIDSDYTVSLEAGFKDRAGTPSQFRHSWHFRTEGAPAITGSSPAPRERNVDPAAYLSIAFNRPMDADSFRSAVTITPPITYLVRSDGIDPRRVVIAPQALLKVHTDYTVDIAVQARDADGNHVPPARMSFTTGPVRSLQHWITFIAGESATADGAGIWMADSLGFPRLLVDGPVDAFSWGPNSESVLISRPAEGWTELIPGEQPVRLPFDARWAASLGAGRGYVYLDGGLLQHLRPDGIVDQVASGVAEVAVSPDFARLAFTVAGSSTGEIDGYDLALHARYVLLRDGATISHLAWSPNGLRLAYVLAGSSGSQGRLRVKSLAGTGAVTTVAAGEIDQPAWLADSNYLTFSSRIAVGGTLRWRLFRINTSLPPPRLTLQNALPTNLAADATSPRPSPDGHQIAFLSGSPEAAHVYLMNADGTGLKRLTGFSADSFPYVCRALHWSGL